MELRVIREVYLTDCTIGRMLVNGTFECYTLEDGIRTNKVAGETAIPAGHYPVTITFSNAFRRQLPLVESVRNFSGIRIHSGNTKKDTQGCILVGQTWTRGADAIGASVLALQALLPKIQAALSLGEPVTLTVEQPNAPPDLALRDLMPVVRRRRGPTAKTAKRAVKRAKAATRASPTRAPRTSPKVARKAGKKATTKARATKSNAASRPSKVRAKAATRKKPPSGSRSTKV